MKLSFSRRNVIQLGTASLVPALLPIGCASNPEQVAGTGDAVVTGPITGGDKGWIYRSPVLDLDKVGYVIEEFFVSGTANSFAMAPGVEAGFDGHWRTEPAAAAPFTTRIFVLRPADPAKYNGVLLAHWQNVSAGFENGYPTGDEIFSGYAWMAVSAQFNGIYGTPQTEQFSLKKWDSARYGALTHPGDAFSYDIYGQSVSAALARSAAGPGGPLGGLKTEKVVAMGGSQSAWRLATYINAVHQHRQVFDGFLLLAHFGVAMPPTEMTIPELLDAENGGRNAHSVQINDRAGVPVMVVNSQAEALTNFAGRQPDSDSFRFWEVAGAPHTPPSTIVMKGLSLERDGIPSETASGQNIVEWDYVKDAAIRDMASWVKAGDAPPRFAPISISMTEQGPAYDMDNAGNVLGGIRPPEVAAAVGRHTAGRPNLLGQTELFSRADMLKLHGSRENFIASWNAAVDELTRTGLIVPGKDQAIRARAEEFWS